MALNTSDVITFSGIDSTMKAKAVAALNTFYISDTISYSVTIKSQPRTGNGNGGNGKMDIGPFNAVANRSQSANTADIISTVFAGDIIGSAGAIVNANDIAASIINAIATSVTQIEAAFTQAKANTFICHSSCHQSCHTSRGRR